jgi:Rieske Fe-S protein
MGMTHGTIAGLLISDLITGRENSWVPLYEPSRTSLRAMGRFMKENLDSARHLIERITPGEVGSVEEIAPGSGAVMRHGGRKVAVYRDRDGTTHELSAVCPHLGCVVGWNAVERSWDCPCHGSRFNPYGQVLNGPATGNLEPVERKEKERRRDERAA